jgi:hypothetical protein
MADSFVVPRAVQTGRLLLIGDRHDFKMNAGAQIADACP